MEEITGRSEEISDSSPDLPSKHAPSTQPTSTAGMRDWAAHPLNIRISLPLPFGRWYLTLVAGRERRGKERLVTERTKHSLETAPNLAFLFSLGTVSAAMLIILTFLVLIHGFGWSVHLVIPA